MLGDATGLTLADLGGPDAVEQPGLAVVDVTHHGDDRGADLEIVLAALILTEGQVERVEQLTVLVLGADDLDLEAHLLAEELQRLRGDGLRRGDHLPQVEQRLDQLGRVDVDLVREVAQRGTLREAQDLAATIRQPDAADLGGPHRVIFLTLLPLGLAAPAGRAAGATERTRGTAATTVTATATRATAETAASGRGSAGSAAATGAEASATRPAGRPARATATGRGTRDLTGHLAGTGTRRHVAGRRTGTALTRGTRTLRRTGTALTRRARTGTPGTGTALAGCRAGAALRTRRRSGPARVRVVADSRSLGAGLRTRRTRAGSRTRRGGSRRGVGSRLRGGPLGGRLRRRRRRRSRRPGTRGGPLGRGGLRRR